MRFSFFISFVVVSVLVYYLLLTDNILHTSITSVVHWEHGIPKHGHFFISGLLPIYISFVIFGGATLVFYLFTKLRNHFSQLYLQKNMQKTLAE